MSDTVEILEAALAGSEKAVRDRDQEIALLNTTLKGFEADLSLANDKVKDRDRTIQDMKVLLQDARNMHALAQEQILELSKTSEKDNLDRARAEHLEQLRAIVQMLEPLATHEDKGSLYLSHFGKAAMVYLIQRVIYANIEKLDPNLKTTYDDL